MRDDTRQALIEHIALDAFTLAALDPAWWDRLHTYAETGWPTGDLPAATIDNGTSSGDRLAQRATQALTGLDDDIRTAAKALKRIAARIALYSPVDAYTPDTLTWCTSCAKNGGHNEPATLNGLCAWCSAFRKSEGHEPPVEILRERHAGRRITRQLIDRHRPKTIRPARARIKARSQ